MDFLLSFCLIFGASCLAAEEAPRYREVIVKVVDERGRRMAGVEVRLVGIGRDAAQADDFASGHENLEAWRFVSDGKGHCVVGFGCFSGFDSQKLTGSQRPGWGQFYLFAEKDGLRGVSPCIIHGGRKGIWTSGPDEWTRRGLIETRSRPVTVTLRMQRGIRVKGRVIDTAGKPVSGYDVGIENDLHSMHHTGYGNEIFHRSIDTDDHGRFMFNGTFPNTFRVRASVEETNLPVWVRTRLRGRWSPEPVDLITPRRGEQVILMTLVVSRQLPFRYAGRVLDGEGKPVSGAVIALGISRHRQGRTYEDDHTFLNANSDADGRFDFRTATPFVRWLSVKASGFADYERDYEAKNTMKAASRWNITLHRP